MAKPRVIYWFRTDLRLHDSPALQAALDLDPSVLWPIFTWDPYYVYKVRGGINRWQFLLDCQNDLSGSINKLNPKSKLFVVREAPQTVFPKLFRAWNVTHLVFEKDTDAYARDRDGVVAKAARDAGVEVIIKPGRTLWDSDEVVAKNGGKPTMSMAQLRKAGGQIGDVPKPISAPETLPDPGEMPIDLAQDGGQEDDAVGGSTDVNSDLRTSEHTGYAKMAGPKADFAIETLEELGFPPATTPHRGGETVALRMLDKIIEDEEYTATFQKPKTSPAAFEPQSTTLLSPFLHFGALSPRLFYWRVQEAVDAFGKGASAPPESLTGQLLFRDMYFAAQAAVGAPFYQAAMNPYCRFIPWHLPSKRDPASGLVVKPGAYRVDSTEAEIWFKRWSRGVTGFPWIDALMRQLREDGWIHHLGRHSVACFLTRGGCYVDWERGAEVFEELLLDHEPACNAGNWQWLSCTAFFSQYFRCYSPVSFGKKWDPDGSFVRRWVPELRKLDKKYIYEPWKASASELKRAGVAIRADGSWGREDGGGSVYPERMFDFDERRRKCMAGMQQAYRVGLYGDSSRVLDGSWRELFGIGIRDGDGDAKVEVRGEEESDDGEFADGVGEDGEAGRDDTRPGGKRAARHATTGDEKRPRK